MLQKKCFKIRSDLLHEARTVLSDLIDKIIDDVFWTCFYMVVFSVC